MYNAHEVFEIGVNIEKNGRLFYQKAAVQTADRDARTLLEELAAWEQSHVELFLDLQSQLGKNAGPEYSFGDEEASAYLQSIAGSHIFITGADIDGIVKKCRTPADTMRVAIGFEKDSVTLYTGMKGLIPEKFGRGDIDKIILEEVRHVSLIARRIALLA